LFVFSTSALVSCQIGNIVNEDRRIISGAKKKPEELPLPVFLASAVE
jgi:hypothetical protein